MILIVNTTTDTSITDEIREALASGNALSSTAGAKSAGKDASSAASGFEIIEAGAMRISHCVGCNECWLKTPGICALKDDYEQILRKLVHADQMWLITETALGFVDHKGKNIIDRMIPLATMNLQFKGKQMRHIPRYKQRTDVGIIYRGDADRSFMERWNQRVTLNLHSHSLGVFPVTEKKEAIACMH
ncbi:MAG: flavodoxin family protein [Clostridiales bacterium]|nr:flavodoxin family protein [Clostridiales bacterium]